MSDRKLPDHYHMLWLEPEQQGHDLWWIWAWSERGCKYWLTVQADNLEQVTLYLQEYIERLGTGGLWE